MLLLKSINLLLVAQRITRTERKIMPGSCVAYGAPVKVLTIQHNHWGKFFFSLYKSASFVYVVYRVKWGPLFGQCTVDQIPFWCVPVPICFRVLRYVAAAPNFECMLQKRLAIGYFKQREDTRISVKNWRKNTKEVANRSSCYFIVRVKYNRKRFIYALSLMQTSPRYHFHILQYD